MENLKEIYKNLANSKITFFKLLILLLLSILLVYILTEYDLSTKNLTQSTKNIFFNIENKTYPKLKTEKNEDHPTIFCLIKTHPNNIKINKTWVVYRIWGRKCDNYRFVTLIPKELIPPGTDTTRTFEIFNQYHMIQPEGLIQETHENLTLKLYYSMRYVYAKFPNYDWYHIVDDDAYVNINNFKKFLSDKNPRDPVTYGFDFKVNVRGGYHSGGPGFVLSNEAFSRIGKALTQNIKNCQNSGIDDVDINACLRNLGVSIGRSLDEKNRHRFLVFNLATHFFGPNPDWIRDATMHALPNGLDCCADLIVSVHYMTPRDVLRLDLAIETQRNAIGLYDEYFKLGKAIRFKDVIKNYLLLEDFENDSKKFNSVLTTL